MNEIANYCELVGADVDQVRKGMGADARIGKRFLFPGMGYGGSCFPKDVQALAQSGQEQHYQFQILEAVMKVNSSQKTILLPRMLDFFRGNLQGKRIAVWGLAFKPDTDDIREAPALEMIAGLLAAGASVCAFDPAIKLTTPPMNTKRCKTQMHFSFAPNGVSSETLTSRP
jgi:UDPglucose 6-dehydrogenase